MREGRRAGPSWSHALQDRAKQWEASPRSGGPSSGGRATRGDAHDGMPGGHSGRAHGDASRRGAGGASSYDPYGPHAAAPPSPKAPLYTGAMPQGFDPSKGLSARPLLARISALHSE